MVWKWERSLHSKEITLFLICKTVGPLNFLFPISREHYRIYKHLLNKKTKNVLKITIYDCILLRTFFEHLFLNIAFQNISQFKIFFWNISWVIRSSLQNCWDGTCLYLHQKEYSIDHQYISELIMFLTAYQFFYSKINRKCSLSSFVIHCLEGIWMQSYKQMGQFGW